MQRRIIRCSPTGYLNWVAGVFLELGTMDQVDSFLMSLASSVSVGTVGYNMHYAQCKCASKMHELFVRPCGAPVL